MFLFIEGFRAAWQNLTFVCPITQQALVREILHQADYWVMMKPGGSVVGTIACMTFKVIFLMTRTVVIMATMVYTVRTTDIVIDTTLIRTPEQA